MADGDSLVGLDEASYATDAARLATAIERWMRNQYGENWRDYLLELRGVHHEALVSAIDHHLDVLRLTAKKRNRAAFATKEDRRRERAALAAEASDSGAPEARS